MPRRKGRGKSKKGRSSKQTSGSSSASSASSSSSKLKTDTTTTEASDTGEKIVVKEGGPVKKQKEEDWFIGLDFGSSSIKVAVVSKSATSSDTSSSGSQSNSADTLKFSGLDKVRQNGPCSESWRILSEAAVKSKSGLNQRLSLPNNGTNTVRIQQDSGGHRTIDNSMTVLSNHFKSGKIAVSTKSQSSKSSSPVCFAPPPLDQPVLPKMFESVIGYESMLAWPRNAKNSVCFVKDLLLMQTDELSHQSAIPLRTRFSEWINHTAKPFGVKSTLRLAIPTDLDSKSSEDESTVSGEKEQITFEIDCNPPYVEPEDGCEEEKDYDDEDYTDDRRRVGLEFILKCIFNNLFVMLSSQLHSRKLHVVFTQPKNASQQYSVWMRDALSAVGFTVIQSIPDHCCAALSVFHHQCTDPRMEKILSDIMSEKEEKSEMISLRTGVFDFGNSECRFTLFDAWKNEGQEWWQFGLPSLSKSTQNISGVSFDQILLKFLIREFEKSNRGLKVDEYATKSRLKLRHLISQMKSKICEALNTRDSHSNITFYGESLMDGIDLDLRVSAAKLDSHFYDFFKSADEWFGECGSEFSKVSDQPCDLIIVTGGTLASMQKRLFPMIRRALNISEDWRVVLPANGCLLGNVTGCALQSKLIQHSLFQISPLIYQAYCNEQF